MYIHTCMHTYIYTCMPRNCVYIHTICTEIACADARASAHLHMCVCARTCVYVYIHTNMYIHTCMHTYIYTRMPRNCSASMQPLLILMLYAYRYVCMYIDICALMLKQIAFKLCPGPKNENQKLL